MVRKKQLAVPVKLLSRGIGKLPYGISQIPTISGVRFTDNDEEALLISIRSSCSEHHLPPHSTERVGLGSYRYGPAPLGHVECKVMVNPTNQNAALEAVLRALERTFYQEGFTAVTIVTYQQYVVEGLTGGYQRWKKKGWQKPNGEERPNRVYWERIAELCEQHEEAGCEVRVWQVNKVDLDG